MRSFRLIFLAIIINQLSIFNGAAQWVTGGPAGETINSIVVSGSGVFASGPGGIFVSSDNGGSWTTANNGLIDTDIFCMAVSGSNIYAGGKIGYGGGIYTSTNNGASWTSLNAQSDLINETDSYIAGLAAVGPNLMVSTGEGFFVSPDNGTTWSKDSTFSHILTSFLITDVGVYGASSEGYGVFFSPDYGHTWTAENNGMVDLGVNTLIATGDEIFAGTTGALYVTANNGSSWTSAVANTLVNSMAAAGPYIFSALYDDGVALSTDSAAHWMALDSGFPDPRIQVNVLAVSGATVFAGTANGVWQLNIADIDTSTSTGIEVLTGYSSVKLYPNPSVGNWQLAVDQSLLGSALEVYDEQGRIVFQSEISLLKSKIDLDVSSGIYYLRISNGEVNVVKKLVKM